MRGHPLADYTLDERTDLVTELAGQSHGNSVRFLTTSWTDVGSPFQHLFPISRCSESLSLSLFLTTRTRHSWIRCSWQEKVFFSSYSFDSSSLLRSLHCDVHSGSVLDIFFVLVKFPFITFPSTASLDIIVQTTKSIEEKRANKRNAVHKKSHRYEDMQHLVITILTKMVGLLTIFLVSFTSITCMSRSLPRYCEIHASFDGCLDTSRSICDLMRKDFFRKEPNFAVWYSCR